MLRSHPNELGFPVKRPHGPPGHQRSCTWARKYSSYRPSIASSSACGRAAARGSEFCLAWSVLRAPGITLVTPGCWIPSAMPIEKDPGASGLRGSGDGRELPGRPDASLEADTRERLPDVERLTAGVVVAMIVGGERGVLGVPPDSRPDASGTRAMMPTRRGRGGQHPLKRLRRSALRMMHGGHARLAIAVSACRRFPRSPRTRRSVPRRPACPVRRTRRRRKRRRRRAVQLHQVEPVGARLTRDRSVQARKFSSV